VALPAGIISRYALALGVALAGWTVPAQAQLFSSTGPVIAILGGELLVGEVTAHLAGWGTIALRSHSSPALTCAGEYSATDALGDAGQLRCSDGASARFEFQRLSLRRGYGAGKSNRGALSFTYGLSAEESASYLKLPAGTALSQDGSNLRLVAAAPHPLR
jgi:hypothetical protein